MNSSNGNNALRSPRIHRRANRSPTIGSQQQQQQQQEVVINPTGQHRYQSSAMAGGPTVISPKAVMHLSSPTMSRKILPNDFSVSPLSSVSNISLSHARTASEHQPNLSVWVPLRTAGGSSSSTNNNYYHQQPQQTTTNAAIRSLPSPLLPHQREGQRNNNVQRNLDVDRESVDTGIATQLCHPPFHVVQRAVYMGRLLQSAAAASAVDAAPVYQMEPVIKSRKVIGALDVTQLINDARCCGSSMTLLPSTQTTAYNYLY